LEAAIRLYLDENLNPKIAEQLRRRGVDAVSARELGALGHADIDHLKRATEMNRVLVTADQDFLRLAAQGIQFAGIVFGVQENHSLGDWVNSLELICFVYEPEEMVNHVEYL
jgi:uncharacterized protein with PIN domain